jgi:hypothetical protein
MITGNQIPLIESVLLDQKEKGESYKIPFSKWSLEHKCLRAINPLQVFGMMSDIAFLGTRQSVVPDHLCAEGLGAARCWKRV